jgi:hypothetical protein
MVHFHCTSEGVIVKCNAQSFSLFNVEEKGVDDKIKDDRAKNASCGLYYKNFTIIIYNCNAICQYYKTMIVVKANYNRS